MAVKMTINIDRLLKGAAAAALCCSAVLAQQAQVQPQAAPAVQDGANGGLGGAESADGRNALRRGVNLSASALASAPYLYLEDGANGYLGNAHLERVKDNMAYQNFDRALVKFSEKLNYKVGDTVDIVNKEKRVSFRGKSEHIVTRKGRAVIDEFLGGKKFVVRLFDMWGVVAGGESVVPTVPFNPVHYVDVAAPDTKIEASVVARLEETVTPYLHQFVIIDKGAGEGVRMGDFFKVKEKKPAGQLSEVLLEGQVVNVAQGAATLVVQKIYKTGLNAGDHAYLSHRLPR